jgi:integrase
MDRLETGRAGSDGGTRPPWSTKKKDEAPRGLFRHPAGVWGIRYTCGAGHVHEEKVGVLKGDAFRAHATRRARVYAEPGWCPAQERRDARARAHVAAAKARTRLTFQQYADTLYLPWAELKRRRSYKTIRTEVTWLVSVLGAQDLAALTQADLERVLDDLQRGHSPSGRPLSGAAVNRYRARLSGMFKRAMKRGLVERNPIAGTEKEAEPSGRIVYLPGETRIRPAIEEQAVREALTPALHPLFTVSVHTGLRWSEQRALQWRDVDLLAGFLTVRHSKNGRTRQVPMNSLVRSVLLDLATQRERPDGPGGHWEGDRPPRGLHVARQPAHFRLPARHGWGRLAHGPAARRVAELGDGPALRASGTRSPAGRRRASCSGSRGESTRIRLGVGGS